MTRSAPAPDLSAQTGGRADRVRRLSVGRIFIGATRSREMRDTMVLSLFAFWAALQVAGDLAGTHGLWFAYVLFLGLRGAALDRVVTRGCGP